MKTSKSIFLDFGELVKIVAATGMPAARVKNWTLGKPLQIQGSIKTGTRTLYSVEDVYRFGLAYELRKSGMAVKPIGKLLERLPDEFSRWQMLTFWRRSESSRFEVMEGRQAPPDDIFTRQVINVAGLRKRLDAIVSRQISMRK